MTILRLIPLTLALALLTPPSCDLCGNRTVKEIPSPDGSNRAVIFERDCGAPTDFSTQISILPVGKKLANEGGNIFIADANHGAAPVDSQGVMASSIVWKSNQQLEITIPRQARIFLQAPEYHGIKIAYKTN